MRTRNLSKQAEFLADFALSVRCLKPHMYKGVGQTFKAWRENNPHVNIDDFRAEHFNHRICEWHGSENT